VLTDAPDFHLRLAKKLKKAGVPVVYLIAPQAWAWREGRVRTLRKNVKRLLCIFPFEEEFFRTRGVPATYIGHPLAQIVKPAMTRAEFCAAAGVSESDRIVVLLPGSRHGEVNRHIPTVIAAAEQIAKTHVVRFVLALPAGFQAGEQKFSERVRAASIQIVEGHTWDALAQAEIALAASGTVTIEGAMLNVPLVTFYRVNALSWILGRWLVRAPFLSMVNLVAGRKLVPELIQRDMTPDKIASEAIRLLDSPGEREFMRTGLRDVADRLRSAQDPMERAARLVEEVLAEAVAVEKVGNGQNPVS
jgi:lipid-A-disaccharide synthase